MKNNYLSGFIGAIIGAIICSLPWILVYVYGGWILSILAALIAFGSLKGYEIFRGKISKKTWIIIAISSILAITISTFVIIPFWLIAKEGLGFSLDYFKQLYATGDFVSAIIFDYAISLLFTILGISGVITNIKKEGYEKDETVIEKPFDLKNPSFEEKVKYLEEIYSKYNAFSKETAVSEFKIMKDLNVTNKLAFIFEMEKKGIIVAPFIKSYFDKEAVNNPESAKKNTRKNLLIGGGLGLVIGIILGLILLIPIISLIELSYDNDNDTNIEENVEEKVYIFKDISLKMPNTFEIMPEESSDEYEVYYNNGDGIIVQTFFNQFDIENSDDDVKEMMDSYVDFLKESFEIIEKEEKTINNINGMFLFLNSKEYKNEYYYLYFTVEENTFYSVMFYTPLEKESTTFNIDLLSFETNVNLILDTLEIQKNTSSKV